jgi:hypothetical protein
MCEACFISNKCGICGSETTETLRRPKIDEYISNVVKVKCDCGKIFLIKDLTNHDCDFKLINCNFGCKEKIKKCDIEKHNKENQIVHTQILLNMVIENKNEKEKLENLNNSNKRKIEELENEIKYLKSCKKKKIESIKIHKFKISENYEFYKTYRGVLAFSILKCISWRNDSKTHLIPNFYGRELTEYDILYIGLKVIPEFTLSEVNFSGLGDKRKKIRYHDIIKDKLIIWRNKNRPIGDNEVKEIFGVENVISEEFLEQFMEENREFDDKLKIEFLNK